MAPNNVQSDKKIALLAQKNKLIEEIRRSEKAIETLRADLKNRSYYYNYDSSDSEDDLPVLKGPSISELQFQQDKLKTCLQATQELTNLTVLQSEVNVLVEDPKFVGKKPVTEAGTWQEVTAECRIDLVPFSITFYMHTPDRKYGPQSYRGLRVVPVKKSHETELENSVLHSLTKPSDAIEVLRSYAVAYRSRRVTLAKLANKYANSLFMEPRPEGFLLKCADLLEVTWRLENKWSPVAPFHHKMKFDLEYIDETYIKIITTAHKQLLDPSIQTDERTLLLDKIISTCFQAKGLVDTKESDLESRTTDQNLEIRNQENVNPRYLEYRDIVHPNSEDNNRNDDHKTKNDQEVMAPPKSLPKKSKNVAKKRTLNDVNNDSSKKIKVLNENENKNEENGAKDDGTKKNKVSETIKRNKATNSNVPAKKTKNTDNIKESEEKNTNSDIISKKPDTKNTEKNLEKPKNANTNIVTKQSVGGNTDKVKKNIDKNVAISKNARNSNSAKLGDIVTNKTNPKNVNGTTKNVVNVENTKKTVKTPKNKPTVANNSNKNKIKSNDNLNKGEISEKIVKDVEKPKDSEKKDKKHSKIKTKSNDNLNKATNSEKIVKDSEKSKDPENKIDNKDNKVKTKSNDNLNKATNSEKIVKDSEKSKDPENKIDKKDNKVKTKSNDNLNKATNSEKIVKDSEKSKDPQNKIDKKGKGAGNLLNKPKPKENAEKQTSNKKNTNPTNINKDSVTNTKNINQNIKNTEKNDNTKTQTKKNINEKEKMVAGNKKSNNPTQSNLSEKNIKNKENIAKTIPKSLKKDLNTIKNKNSDIENNKRSSLPPKTTDNQKNIIKQPIKTIRDSLKRLSTAKNALKTQNIQKNIKPGNTKNLNTGNTIENGVSKISKIPQKKNSPMSQVLRKNILRISPRKMSLTSLKSTSQDSNKQKMIKMTNIPRLLKKPTKKVL